MGSRDDMVIRPDLGRDQGRSASPVRAREERILAREKKRGGLISKVAKMRAGRRLVRGRRARASRRAVRLAQSGSAAVRGAQTARAASAAANPIGLAVVAAVVATGVITRLVSGRSFENMGAQINKMLLGDMDEAARADIDTRKRLGGDREVARIIGIEGKVNNQIARLHADLARLRKMELDGSSKITEDKYFQSNSAIDMLILRAKEVFEKVWKSSDGPDAVEEIKRKHAQTLRFKGYHG